MPAPRHDEAVLQQTLEAYRDAGGDQTEAARTLGIPRSTFLSRLARAKKLGVDLKKLEAGGQVEAMRTKVNRLPKRGQVKRYICTSAQNNTKVWHGFENLKALADHYGAEILVGTFSYKKSSYGKASVKRGAKTGGATSDETWYDPAIVPFIRDERVQLAPGLVWCGEQNILPTATDPLTGFETYNGRQSGIFPHARIEMRSVPSAKFEGTKLNYSTGTITQRNYIQKRAGLRAEFAHCYGGLLVEVCPDGTWFVRQLHAGEDDSVYDLDLRVQAGEVTAGNRVEALSWGDVHTDMLEDEQRDLAWGKGGIMDLLRPRHQFLHDVLDFRSRNHWDLKNPHRMFEKHVQGRESVRDEVARVRALLLETAARPDCETVVVSSNHDMALERWLCSSDYRSDPLNAEFFLELQLEKYRAMRRGDEQFYTFERAIAMVGGAPEVRFLHEDESYVICHDDLGGIECGIHGDNGPNGSRGTPHNLSRLGRATSVGHTHSAGIFGRLYVAGVMGNLDMKYNKGPSSWTHSHIVTYPNGRRAIVTTFGGRFRA